jgi:hypothetical protein
MPHEEFQEAVFGTRYLDLGSAYPHRARALVERDRPNPQFFHGLGIAPAPQYRPRTHTEFARALCN